MTVIKRVLVAGATGATGRELVERLRSADVAVHALTRDHRSISALADAGVSEVVVGDLFDPDAASRAVEGVDAVLCAVRTSRGLSRLVGDLVEGAGVQHLVAAAAAADVKRFVLCSSRGAGDVDAPLLLPGRRRVLMAQDRGERALRESGLTHTVFRPTELTDEDATDVVVGEGGGVRGSVPRAALARTMVAALATPKCENRTLDIAAGDALDGEPSGVVDVTWATPGPAATVRS